MQKVVWSETTVKGGRHFDGALPAPSFAVLRRGAGPGVPPPADLGYYQDIAVVAFPTPANAAYRIPNIQFRASFQALSTPPGASVGIPMLPITYDSLPADSRIDQPQIRNLTAQFQNGRLSWDVPPGHWTVLRFGHASTGESNHPCPPAGEGLECDKMSKAAMDLHFSKFIGELASRVGPLAPKALVSTHIDSWECGSQNWTMGFREEFLKRCGYDIVPFLPVMTGRAVGNREVSERFLWDLRKTISDMICENYAGRLRELAHQNGLRLSIEAYDGDPMDEMSYAGQADEPQTEFWYGWAHQPPGQAGDNYPKIYRSYTWTSTMVSAAHTYGKRIIAAESFTASPGEDWLAHPATLKPLGDWAFCQGVNRFVVHRYAMQPFMDRKPGMTMGPYGVHYERTQTWWEESKPWHEYLTRCQFLLRQGGFVADLCYLQPEGAPMRFMPPGVDMTNPVPPDTPGYNFDGCTAEVVLKRMSVKNGRIVLPDGMSYRMLVLPRPGEQPTAGVMTPGLLKRIAELVDEGMILVGPPPLKSPSLANYPECDRELKDIADHLWGDTHIVPSGDRGVGNGRVIWGQTPQQTLAAMGVPMDFSCGTPAPFRYTHRRMDDGTEIYFVASKEGAPTEALCTFRVSGLRPELWWPESGRIERPAMYDQANGTTRFSIRLNEFGSVFVVFPGNSAVEADRVTAVMRNGAVLNDTGRVLQLSRGSDGTLEGLAWQPGEYALRSANGKSYPIAVAPLPDPLPVTGPWELQFTPNWGAPPRVDLPELISWSEHADAGVKYFSGKATYRKQLQVPPIMLGTGRSLCLDLGEVQVMASVKLNGKNLGTLWKPPFRVDITGATRAGDNLLEITVVNLWPNRLIGDANLPDNCEWNTTRTGQTLKAWPKWLLEDKPSPTGRFTFSILRVWPKDAPLLKSGLLGPVTLHVAARVT